MNTKQTEALKLALEALEDTLSGDLTPYQAAKTITVIREALAEQPAQQQEPVAILNHAHGVHTIRSVRLNGLPDGEYKLYTSPPASKPLTDEQWHKVHRAALEAFFGCALDSVHGQIQCAAHAAMRATEAAHGIGDKK